MAEIKISSASRILARLARYKPDSPEMAQALFAIGNLVANRAKVNLTTMGAVGSYGGGGQLRARTTFRIEKAAGISTVSIGAFGVKYARMVEFGGVMTKRQMRAMFASFNERGMKRRPGKGIIVGMRYRGRPALTNAFAESRPSILAALAKVGGK
jgi:hypothetical protein